MTPLKLVDTLYANRYILGQLIKRDVVLRYRGAMFGVAWMFLSPLLMLGIFAFVFGQIFQARWPQQATGIPFALLLYSGLIAFNVFAESLSRAPASIRSYPSYVKKIIFPLEILPLVPLGTALVHAAFNFLLLIAALGWVGELRPSLLLLPLLLLPLILLALGCSWFLAAWGVFIKDMSQIVPLILQMLLFLSPVFYPIQAVPHKLQPLYQFNPLGIVIESLRSAISGYAINWSAWAYVLAASTIACTLGYAFFQHSRQEFADVL